MIVICLDLWYITAGFNETFKETMEFAHNNSLIHIKQRSQLNSALIGESRAPPWPKKIGKSLSRQVYWASWQLCSWGPNSTPGRLGIPFGLLGTNESTYLHENGWVFKYGKYVGFILHPMDALETNISPSSLVLLSGGDFPAFTFGGTC